MVIKPKKTTNVATIRQPNELPEIKIHHVWMDDGSEALAITQVSDKKKMELVIVSLDGLGALMSTLSDLKRYYHPAPIYDHNPDQLTLF